MTTSHNHTQSERMQPQVAQLSDEERKLLQRIDQRATDREARHSQIVGRLLSTPLLLY